MSEKIKAEDFPEVYGGLPEFVDWIEKRMEAIEAKQARLEREHLTDLAEVKVRELSAKEDIERRLAALESRAARKDRCDDNLDTSPSK